MWRRLVLVLALLGVLVHAAALARHVVLVATRGAVTMEAALLADLGVICHVPAAWDASGSEPVGLQPSQPSEQPGGGQKSCPLCAGLASLHILPPPDFALLPVQRAQHVAQIAGEDQRRTFQRRIRPPGRAPPVAISA